MELALAVNGNAKHTNAEKTADVAVLFFTSLLSVLILRVTSSVGGKGAVANNERRSYYLDNFWKLIDIGIVWSRSSEHSRKQI